MNKKIGIWIDTKMAVIVFLEENDSQVKTIYSSIESRVRIPGETKWFTRFGNQYLNFEKKTKNRRANQVREFLKKVVNAIKPDVPPGRKQAELVLFGPAVMKAELEKAMLDDTTFTPFIRAVETADSMTENQVVAWVKNYFQTGSSNKNQSLN